MLLHITVIRPVIFAGEKKIRSLRPRFFSSRAVKARRSIIRISNASGKREKREKRGERCAFIGDADAISKSSSVTNRLALLRVEPRHRTPGYALGTPVRLFGATREGPRRLERLDAARLAERASERVRRSENL